MNRRDMILTTAAATVTASTGAARGGMRNFEQTPCADLRTPSPVIAAARRWHDQYQWIDRTELTDDETDAAVLDLNRMEADLLGLEPADDRELLVQLMIITSGWEGVGELYEREGNIPLLRARCQAFKERVL